MQRETFFSIQTNKKSTLTNSSPLPKYFKHRFYYPPDQIISHSLYFNDKNPGNTEKPTYQKPAKSPGKPQNQSFFLSQIKKREAKPGIQYRGLSPFSQNPPKLFKPHPSSFPPSGFHAFERAETFLKKVPFGSSVKNLTPFIYVTFCQFEKGADKAFKKLFKPG